MKWFDRYEYEQDKKRYLRKVSNKVLDILVLIGVVGGVFVWKFSNHIDWEVFKDLSIIKYIIYALICVVILAIALVNGIFEFVPWVMSNKKKTLKIFAWIITSFVTLFAFCALLAKLILSANNTYE